MYLYTKGGGKCDSSVLKGEGIYKQRAIHRSETSETAVEGTVSENIGQRLRVYQRNT